MLRHVVSGAVSMDGADCHLWDGKQVLRWDLSPQEVKALKDGKAVQLARLAVQPANGYRRYWVVADKIFETSDSELTTEDVVALVNEAENKRRIRLAKAHALQAMAEQLDTGPKRDKIPTDVKVQVWQRDGGRCVECGSNRNIEFDHIIPLSLGGANSFRNLQLLCEDCNRRKGASLG